MKIIFTYLFIFYSFSFFIIFFLQWMWFNSLLLNFFTICIEIMVEEKKWKWMNVFFLSCLWVESVFFGLVKNCKSPRYKSMGPLFHQCEFSWHERGTGAWRQVGSGSLRAAWTWPSSSFLFNQCVHIIYIHIHMYTDRNKYSLQLILFVKYIDIFNVYFGRKNEKNLSVRRNEINKIK